MRSTTTETTNDHHAGRYDAGRYDAGRYDAMKAWIKLHTEIIDDPKIGRLSFADKGLWLCLLALAGKIDDRAEDGTLTGQIGSLEDIAWHLRTPAEDIEPALHRLSDADMIHRTYTYPPAPTDIWIVTHFAERQAIDTDAERARNYRASRTNKAPSRNRHATVTQPSRDRHHTDQNREDTEAEQNREESDNSRTEQTRAQETRARVAAVAAALSADRPAVAATPPAATPLDASRYDATTLAAGNAEVDRATKALTELGIEPTLVRKIVTHAPYAHIIGWANYARNQPGLQNPAGYVIKMLRAGDPPPRSLSETPHKTWFTAEEETMFFGPDKKPVNPAVIPAKAGNQCTT